MDETGGIAQLKLGLLDSRLDLLRRTELEHGKNGDKEATEKAARQFESYFIEYILQSMQKTVDAWKDKDNNAQDVYMSMIYRDLADKLAEGGGIGIAKMLTEHVKPADGTGTPAAEKITLPTPLPAFPDGNTARMTPPVNGPVSSDFGWRIDPFTGKQAFHRGIDIAVVPGTPVRAISGGVVEAAGESPDFGQVVVIRHSNGLKSVYGHLSALSVHPWMAVAAGDTLGLSGNTGRSTGPHLHLEILAHGQAVNPAGYLKNY